MKIEETPSLPYADKKLVDKYLKTLLRETGYKAYSIDDEFNVIEGVGTIDSDGSYNYHNNYDDSEDTLIFTSTNKYGHKTRAHKWWTLNKAEADNLCEKEKKKFVKKLTMAIKKLS